MKLYICSSQLHKGAGNLYNFQQYTSSRLFKQKMNSNKQAQSEETTVNFKPKSSLTPSPKGK